MSLRLLLGQSISMPDGTRLHVDILLPAASAPAPTLLTLTPYTTDFCFAEASRYAHAGFAAVVVDVRGRGGSQGEFALYGDAADGAACVAWAAAQSWSNGAVGLFGGSYSGLNQWQIAALRPSALRAIAPVVAPMPGYDTEFYNGLFNLNNLRWAAFIRGRQSRTSLIEADAFWRERFTAHYLSEASIEALASLTGTEDPVVALMTAKWDDLAFWQALVPSTDAFAAIEVPVLSVTGTADNAQRGALEFHRRHLAARPGAQHWLVIGPWTHGGERHPEPSARAPESDDRGKLPQIDFEWLCAFYRWALSQPQANDRLPPPALLPEPLMVYIQEQERWCGFAQMPSQSARIALSTDSDDRTEAAQHHLQLTVTDQRQSIAELFASGAASWFDLLGGEQATAAWPYQDDLPGAITLPISIPKTRSATILCGRPRGQLLLRLPDTWVDLAVLLAEQGDDGGYVTLSSEMLRLPARKDAAWQTVALDGFRFCARAFAPDASLILRLVILSTPEYQLPDDGLRARDLSVDLSQSWVELPVSDQA